MRSIVFVSLVFLSPIAHAQTYPQGSGMDYEQQFMQRQYQQDIIELQRQQAVAQAIQAEQLQQQLQQQQSQPAFDSGINTQLFAPR